MNLIIISSVINISTKPFSYTNTRSYCGKEKRFEDTKKTIESIKEFIKDSKLFFVECSDIPIEYEKYIIENTDYYINLYNDKKVLSRCDSISKSLGEGTILVEALKYIFENKIEYDNLFKLSGRYWLNNSFDYSKYDNDSIVVKQIENDPNNILTCFYKFPKRIIEKFYNFLLNSERDFINCIGIEVIFGKFINSIDEEKIFIKGKIGLNGYVSVCGTYIDI